MKMWMYGGIVGWLWGLTGLTLVSSSNLHAGLLKTIGISLIYVPSFFASTVIHPFAPQNYIAMNNFMVWITIPLSGAIICAGVGYVYEAVRVHLSSPR